MKASGHSGKRKDENKSIGKDRVKNVNNAEQDEDALRADDTMTKTDLPDPDEEE
jgi:hypothetical protein